ncbi:MAG: hypothetical protein QF682_05485 [Candidatus Thermoplasmatota archaeon]|jgi:hypothetical protein|nr:hypothetical protein [Candidatus Thermoplasmatota archaeon]
METEKEIKKIQLEEYCCIFCDEEIGKQFAISIKEGKANKICPNCHKDIHEMQNPPIVDIFPPNISSIMTDPNIDHRGSYICASDLCPIGEGKEILLDLTHRSKSKSSLYICQKCFNFIIGIPLSGRR